jgi:hypothetical protein
VFELVKSALVPGTVGASLVATVLVVLRYGPEALKTVIRELIRLRLIRLHCQPRTKLSESELATYSHC